MGGMVGKVYGEDLSPEATGGRGWKPVEGGRRALAHEPTWSYFVLLKAIVADVV